MRCKVVNVNLIRCTTESECNCLSSGSNYESRGGVKYHPLFRSYLDSDTLHSHQELLRTGGIYPLRTRLCCLHR